MSNAQTELNKVSEIVEEILKENEYARENDLWLLLSVWKKQGIKFSIQTPLTGIPNPESIRRCRQLFNSKGLYLPNNPEVLKQRRIKQEAMQKWSITN